MPGRLLGLAKDIKAKPNLLDSSCGRTQAAQASVIAIRWLSFGVHRRYLKDVDRLVMLLPGAAYPGFSDRPVHGSRFPSRVITLWWLYSLAAGRVTVPRASR